MWYEPAGGQRVRVSHQAADCVRAVAPGRAQGFDEYMNLVMDHTEEVNMKTKARETVGKRRVGVR